MRHNCNRQLFPPHICQILLGLDSILPCWEVHLLLLLFLRDSAGVLFAQSPPNCAGLLGSKVERKVLLAGVELAEGVSLVGVDDCQATGDRFAEVMTEHSISIRDGMCMNQMSKLTFLSVLKQRLLRSSVLAMCRAQTSRPQVGSLGSLYPCSRGHRP